MYRTPLPYQNMPGQYFVIHKQRCLTDLELVQSLLKSEQTSLDFEVSCLYLTWHGMSEEEKQ